MQNFARFLRLPIEDGVAVVVGETVGDHQVEVFFHGGEVGVEAVVELLPHGAQVHRFGDHGGVVRDFFEVNGLAEDLVGVFGGDQIQDDPEARLQGLQLDVETLLRDLDRLQFDFFSLSHQLAQQSRHESV
jgi:hypothetical protein